MKIYMIVISDNETSQYYKNRVLPSWQQLGYEVDEFEAVTPKTLPSYSSINFAEHKSNKGNNKFTDTEKSVWYSHYLLWKKCVELGEPIHIIEHDTFLFDYVPDFSDEEIALFAFYQKSYERETVAPCAGYYITPQSATDLIHKAENFEIELNVDWTVHDTFEDYHPETQRKMRLFQMVIAPVCVARQIVEPSVGTTIQHNI